MLDVRGLECSYGVSQVLFGIDLEIGQGEVVSLLGRNGMGKSTTVRAIMGLIPANSGEVIFEGRSLKGLPPHTIARAGLGLVPEGRQIFPNLTVREQLIATASSGRNGKLWTEERIYQLFPTLAERRDHWGLHLSGGEQQMLAIGRALMTNPKLLILDEATEGLAPLVRAEIWRCLSVLRDERQSILVIDKNLDALLRLADRHYIVSKGHIVWHGDSAGLQADSETKHRHLGV